MKVHAKSPLRLGLAGGGTDVSPYSDLYGGHVLNATISLYTHCEISIAADGLVRFEASDFGQCIEIPVAPTLSIDGMLRLHCAVYNRMVKQFNSGEALAIKVLTYSDAPPGSGVGSSSALVVAMVAAYCELLKIPLGEYDIAYLAFEIERIDCAMAGGKQDQYAAAFGGFNFMDFKEHGHVLVNPLRLKRELINELECRLLLYYTGRSRSSAKIIEEQIEASKSPNGDAIEAMHEVKRAAVEMKEALLRGEIGKVLRIIGASWLAKKRSASAISNSHIEAIANLAIEAGACGVKVSGAGGGGFMMIAVDPLYRHRVMRALESCDGQFFSFGFVNEGVETWTCIR